MTASEIEALLRRGEVDAALVAAREKLAGAREQGDDAALALALLDEARAESAHGDRDDAVMTVDEAIGTARRAFGVRDPRVAEAFELGADIAAAADMPYSADARFATALEILEAAGVGGAARAHVLLHYGLFRQRQADPEGAAGAFAAAIELAGEATDPEGRALYPTALTELAFLALEAGRDAEARELADRALERWVELRQARRFEVADALCVVGLAALRQGEPETTATVLEMACEIYRASKVDVRARHGRAASGHAEALARLGRTDEARAAFRQAIGLLREGAPERVLLEERLLELARR